MQREEFGRICASLRQDIKNEKTGKAWSQTDLARACRLSHKKIGQIERGERVNLDKETLLRLANAFRFSTIERKRFFRMVNNVDHEQLPRAGQSFEKVKLRVLGHMAEVYQPALLHDGLYRIRAINSAYMQVYGLTQLYLDSIPDIDPTKYHISRHIFDPESPVRAAYSRHLNKTEMNNVSYWRFLSMAYRHSADYEQIQNHLTSSYPNFFHLWGELSQKQEQLDRINLLRGFEQNHPALGHLKYTVISNQLFAGEQELYLALLVPKDRPTFGTFTQLVEDVGFQLRIFN